MEGHLRRRKITLNIKISTRIRRRYISILGFCSHLLGNAGLMVELFSHDGTIHSDVDLNVAPYPSSTPKATTARNE